MRSGHERIYRSVGHPAMTTSALDLQDKAVRCGHHGAVTGSEGAGGQFGPEMQQASLALVLYRLAKCTGVEARLKRKYCEISEG